MFPGDMTHMFVATITSDNQLKVETYKFVLKNGLLGVLEDKPGKFAENWSPVAKLTEPLSVIEDLPKNPNDPGDKNYTPAEIAYIEDHLQGFMLDHCYDMNISDEHATTSLEDFKEKFDYFAEMLPESCLENPTMVGFFKEYTGDNDDDARYRTVKILKNERYGEDISKPAPYRKPKTFEQDNDTVLYSTGLFAIHQTCDSQNSFKYRLGYFDFKLTVGGKIGVTADSIYVFKGEHAMLSLLKELLTNHQHQYPSVIAADSRMEKHCGIINYYANCPSPMFEAPWFRIPWAPRGVAFPQVSSGYPYDGPPEDGHIQLPPAEYFQAMLPEKWQDGGFMALGFVHPSTTCPSKEDFTVWQVSEHFQKENNKPAPFTTTEEILSKIEKQFGLGPGELADAPQPMSRKITIDETGIVKQQNPRDLWDGKVHILNPDTGRYEELKMMTDEQFKNMTVDTEKPDFETNPEYYQGFTGTVELIDITENLSFNGGNAVKYIARSTRVDGVKKHENPITDLRKAIWYIEREIERLEWEK